MIKINNSTVGEKCTVHCALCIANTLNSLAQETAVIKI